MAAAPLRWSRPKTRAEWQARVDRAAGGLAVRPRDYLICLALQAVGITGELYAIFIQRQALWGLAMWATLCLLPGLGLLLPWLKSLRLPQEEPATLQVARVPAAHQRRWHHTPGTFEVLARVRTSEVPLLVGDLIELDDLVEADRASRQERLTLVRRGPVRMTRPEPAVPILEAAPPAPGLAAPRPQPSTLPAAPATPTPRPMVRRDLSSISTTA